MRALGGCLPPDRPVLGALWGGESLRELRTALALAEDAVRGGAAPHVGPAMAAADAAALLPAAGLAHAAVAGEDVRVDYPAMGALLRDLQLMGESSAVSARTYSLRRAVLARAALEYAQRFPSDTRPGCVRATFHLLTFIAWTPANSAV